jgi:DNA-binding MarR family transcriptional regulator
MNPRPAIADGEAQVATSVWVRLLKAHGLLLREVRRRVPAPLTLPQFDVLAQLHRTGAMTPGALTRELLVTAGNLTGIVERLVRMKLISRHRVPEDGRAVRVQLTPRGRQLMGKAIPRHRRDVAALLSVLPAGELRRLRVLLGTLGEELQSRTDKPKDRGALGGRARGRAAAMRTEVR